MSDHYFCANCWQKSAREQLLYRCLACGDPTLPPWLRSDGGLRPVRELVGRLRRGLGLFGNAPLACPRHPDARLRLACPVCKKTLSEASAVRRPVLALGVAGPQSAGKTLFILSMVPELRRRQFGDRSIGLMGIDGTDERFETLAMRLRKGEKPEATPPTSEHQERDLATPVARNFCWQVQTAGPGRRTPPSFLALYDVAGETWGKPTPEALERFDRYLASLTSLIFLVDGATVARDIGVSVKDAWDARAGVGGGEWADNQWLSHVRTRLGARARQVDLALVLAKADHLWYHTDWEALRPAEGNGANVEAALQRLLVASGRAGLLTEAHQTFRRVGLFAVSSVGFLPAAVDVKKVRGSTPKLVRPLAPVGVVEPVVWLLAKRMQALRTGEP